MIAVGELRSHKTGNVSELWVTLSNNIPKDWVEDIVKERIYNTFRVGEKDRIFVYSWEE